jgi:hypothetical protein
MDLAKRIALLAPVFVLLACGGSTTQVGGPGNGDGGTSCPSPTVVGGGGSCSDPGESCSGTVSVPNECGTGGGGTTTAQCTCQDGSWQCPVAFTGGAGCPVPDPGCPDPSQVQPGNTCSTSPQDSCTSTIPIPSCNGAPEGYVQCNCEQGVWACEEFGGPACPIEAGVCPDPSQVYDGQGCDTYGTTCQGDPQFCGGTTVYDTLQCYAGAWTLVAQTFCDEADAGFADAQTTDGGQGI